MTVQKGSQRSRDLTFGTGSAGSLAHASSYFNSAKYVNVAYICSVRLSLYLHHLSHVHD